MKPWYDTELERMLAEADRLAERQRQEDALDFLALCGRLIGGAALAMLILLTLWQIVVQWAAGVAA